MYKGLVISAFFIILVSGCTSTGDIVRDFGNESPEEPANRTQATQSSVETSTECEGIKCFGALKICEDGTRVTCSNTCINGKCTDCEPECPAPESDECANVICADTRRICPDYFEARCTNFCVEGRCTQCMPDCAGHENIVKTIQPDPCAGITCQDSVLICPDGFNATCQNSCSSGACSSCNPDCSGHQCQEDWYCTEWSACITGDQARTCTDLNGCGTTANKPPEIQNCTNEPPQITNIQYDPPGDDRVNINEEWVEITGYLVDMTNWTLIDAANHKYTFPDGFIVQNSVRVRSGNGQNNQTDLYWGSGSPIWNNDGDTATLKDSQNNTIDTYAY